MLFFLICLFKLYLFFQHCKAETLMHTFACTHSRCAWDWLDWHTLSTRTFFPPVVVIVKPGCRRKSGPSEEAVIATLTESLFIIRDLNEKSEVKNECHVTWGRGSHKMGVCVYVCFFFVRCPGCAFRLTKRRRGHHPSSGDYVGGCFCPSL